MLVHLLVLYYISGWPGYKLVTHKKVGEYIIGAPRNMQ